MKYKIVFAALMLCGLLTAQTEDSLRVNNAVLHYYTYGSGESILLLSGGPGVSGKQEDDLAKTLSKKYQAIILDQRGTGKSKASVENEKTINLQTAVADLEALRIHLKIDKYILSGHSWGGMLASAYIAKYPENVKAVIIIGGGELDLAKSEIINASIHSKRQLAIDSAQLAYWNNKENREREKDKYEQFRKRTSWKCFTHDQSKLDAVMEQANHGAYADEMGRLMWKSLKAEKFNVINAIQKNYKGKSLIIYGYQDPVGANTVDMYKEAYQSGEFIGINKCGHMPTVEAPEEFYEAIFKFLKKI